MRLGSDVTAVLTDGRRIQVLVEHAIGSLQNPMSDGQLEAKFRGLCDPVLASPQSASLIDACWQLAGAPGLLRLTGLAIPG